MKKYFFFKGKKIYDSLYRHLCLLILLGSLAFTFIFSIVHLESDPSPLKFMDDILDEGAWAHNAKIKVFFGQYFVHPDQFGYAFFGSPIFTFMITLFFKLGGVNLYSARLLTLIFFWGILLQIFYLFKKQGNSTTQSLVPVVLFGLNHQSLIYARWATPIYVEAFFALAACTSLSHAMSKPFQSSSRSFYFLLTGILSIATILAKLTAVLLLPAYSAILFVLFYKKRITFSDLRYLLLGLMIPAGIFLIVILSNLENFSVFLNFLSRRCANIFSGSVSETPISYNYYSIFNNFYSEFILNRAFANPCIAPMLFSVSFYIGASLSKIKGISSDVKSDLILSSSFSLLCLGSCCYLFNADRFDRRFIIFYIPITLIYSRILLHLSEYKEKLYTRKSRILTKALLAFSFLLTYLIYINQIEKNLNWTWLYFLHGSYQSFLCTTPLRLLAIFLIFFLVLICSVRTLSFLSAISLLLINVGFNVIWLSHPTYTLKNSSYRLDQWVRPGDYVTGYMPWLFAFESRTHEIWYRKGSDTRFLNFNFLSDVSTSGRNLLLIENDFNNPEDLSPVDFRNFHVKPMGEIHLAPLPGSGIFRIHAKVTKVEFEKNNKSASFKGD